MPNEACCSGVMAFKSVELGRHEEGLQGQCPRSAHPGFQQRCQKPQHARLADELPGDLKIGLSGGPATDGVDRRPPLHRPPRSIAAACSSFRTGTSASRSDKTVTPLRPAARIKSGSRVLTTK